MSEIIFAPPTHEDCTDDTDSMPDTPTHHGSYKAISLLPGPESADVENLEAVLQTIESHSSHRPHSSQSEATSEAVSADHINMNTVMIASEAETQTQSQESAVCTKKFSSSFDKDLCRVPGLFNLQPLEYEFLTFTLFKKTTWQLGGQQASTIGAGSVSGSVTRVPALHRTLEDYVKKETAEY